MDVLAHPLVQTILTAGGGSILTLLTQYILTYRKQRADSRKVEAEADKIHRESEQLSDELRNDLIKQNQELFSRVTALQAQVAQALQDLAVATAVQQQQQVRIAQLEKDSAEKNAHYIDGQIQIEALDRRINALNHEVHAWQNRYYAIRSYLEQLLSWMRERGISPPKMDYEHHQDAHITKLDAPG